MDSWLVDGDDSRWREEAEEFARAAVLYLWIRGSNPIEGGKSGGINNNLIAFIQMLT